MPAQSQAGPVDLVRAPEPDPIVDIDGTLPRNDYAERLCGTIMLWIR